MLSSNSMSLDHDDSHAQQGREPPCFCPIHLRQCVLLEMGIVDFDNDFRIIKIPHGTMTEKLMLIPLFLLS